MIAQLISRFLLVGTKPTVAVVCVFLLAATAGCRTEGERLVDELTGSLEKVVVVMETPPEDGRQPVEAALELLEEQAVRMRQLESRLDDVVRTMNERQREELARYAAGRFQAIEDRLAAAVRAESPE